jgi:glycosyltransferase involved in cell wall biosynthesis
MLVRMFAYNALTNDARVFRQARALAERGHAVEVVGWSRPGLAASEERDGFTILRVRRDPVHWRARRFAWRLYRGLWRRLGRPVNPNPPPQRRKGFWHRQLTLIDWLRRVRRLSGERSPADVYVAHDLNTLPVAAAAARRAGARLLYDSHELFVERGLLSPVERPIWKLVERRLIRRADIVTTVSEPIAAELARRYGVETPTLIQNCPDLPERTPDARAAAERLRDRAGLDGDEPIILYQGAIQPERGLFDLVEAAGRIGRGVVVLMGSGRLKEELRERIDAAGLAQRVRLVDPVPPEELLGYTAGATIGVHPMELRSLNNYYAAPNKLFEYMAVGLPVVVSRLPVMERVVTEHEIGLICEPSDPPSLAAAIDRLLSDDELYERCRRNALAAAEVYNWGNESQKLIALYDELARPA